MTPPRTTAARPGLPLLILLLIPVPFGLAGCGGDRSGRLAPGSMATARGEGDGPVPLYFSETTEQLPAGTVVRVISDAEAEADPARPRRRVVVGLLDGPHRGLAAQMQRSDLRPGG